MTKTNKLIKLQVKLKKQVKNANQLKSPLVKVVKHTPALSALGTLPPCKPPLTSCRHSSSLRVLFAVTWTENALHFSYETSSLFYYFIRFFHDLFNRLSL